jgi:hypothetical protein
MFDTWRERRRRKREEKRRVSDIIGAGKERDEAGQVGKDEEVPADATIIATRGGKFTTPGL